MMSWSFQIANGDLAIGSNGLNTATGSQKLVQDLSSAILTQMGRDPLHASYGSIMDGGTDPTTGQQYTGAIGEINDPQTQAWVQTEMQRICNVYQSNQIARNRSDVATYGKSTLTADEALLNVSQIAINSSVDNMLVTVVLQTGVGSLPLAIPFSVS